MVLNITEFCNLASIALSMFVKVKNGNPYFDYATFQKVTRKAVRNLDNVIDANYYPTKETETSNMKHRPV